MKSNLEILTVSETELDDKFPDRYHLFHIDDCHIFKKDRNCFGRGLMTFNKIRYAAIFLMVVSCSVFCCLRIDT